MKKHAETILCLEFLSTITGTPSKTQQDLLLSYRGFVSWAVRARVISAAEAEDLSDRALKEPAAARSALAAIHRMRGLLSRLTSISSAGEGLPESDVAELGGELSRYMTHATVIRQEGGLRLGFVERGASLDWPASRILWSALQLLMGGDGVLGRLKRCANSSCGRLFIDMSRNKSRRWCDMSSCGNREKARRFHSRKKAAAGTSHARTPEVRAARIPRRYAGSGDVEVGTDD